MIGPATLALNGLPLMDDAAPPSRPSRPGPASGVPLDGAPLDAETSFDLVIRAREGDQVALDALFDRYSPRLRRWAHGRLPYQARGAHDTQDLVQETLTKVFQRLHAFEPRHAGAFREYVWTTMWNAVRDMARKYQRRGIAGEIDAEFPGTGPSPLEEAIGAEVLLRYERAMERLRPEDREAIVARIEMGLPYVDVAASLDKPSVEAAHMAVSRALVKLAREMAHERTRAR